MPGQFALKSNRACPGSRQPQLPTADAEQIENACLILLVAEEGLEPQIKQHLRIKAFFGESEKAVKTQIWIAVSVYVLVAIIS